MNNMRIGGLATGMDIDKLVGDLMKAERIPLTKMQQDHQYLTWQRDAYREMNTLFLNFRSELTQMQLSSSFRARTTSSTNESLVNAAASSAASETSYTISEVSQLASAASKVNNGTVFNDPSAVDTSQSLQELKSQLFRDFTWSNGSVESEQINVSTASDTFNLTELEGASIKNANSEMSIKVNGQSYEVVTAGTQADLTDSQVLVDATNGTLTFKNSITEGSTINANYIASSEIESTTLNSDTNAFQLNKNALSPGSLNITVNGSTTYTTNSNGEVLDTDGTTVIGSVNYETGNVTLDNAITSGSTVDFNYQQKYVNFNVGSHTSSGYKEEIFNVQGSESLDQIINKVNNSDVGVSMFYDSQSGQMTLTRTETGNFNGLNPEDADYLNNNNHNEIITSGTFVNQVFRFGSAIETGGENAKFTLNGLETERTTNNFEVNGVTFNLKKEFSGQNVTINVNNDSATVFDNIKGFVEKYNELIDKVQDKLQEEQYRDYKPLTDKQREDMSESQIKLWVEKAKSGLLRSDSILGDALSDMRRDFYSSVENGQLDPMLNQLAAIGITTTSNYRDGGKLVINESKLKSAIETDSESVEKLFTSKGTTYNQEGILERLKNTVNTTMDQITEKAGNSFQTSHQYTMGRKLESLDERIWAFEDRLTRVENRYWSQFTQMEKAIQRMNQQSAYLMQQFGGGM